MQFLALPFRRQRRHEIEVLTNYVAATRYPEGLPDQPDTPRPVAGRVGKALLTQKRLTCNSSATIFIRSG
jgi:hypothetical protein